jgi:hypothetical protein
VRVLYCFVEGVVWEYPHCHDIRVHLFNQSFALSQMHFPKNSETWVIGALLYFKKQIDNGVPLYESISADIELILMFIYLFLLEIPEFFIGDPSLVTGHFIAQILLSLWADLLTSHLFIYLFYLHSVNPYKVKPTYRI